MLRRIIRTAAVLFATVLFTLNSQAAPSTYAKSAILMDGYTGAVLYSHCANERSLIASTTKIMTALVVLEHCDVETEFTVPPEATKIEGSSMYLKPGEVLTVRELLYGLMLHSGNDAAVALALACSDSVEEFVALMNLKAQELELKNTHFENPNGLDGENHYSTAYDLAKLSQYALNNESFKEIVSTKSIHLGERYFSNHNKLLWLVEGAIGVKTGYTRAAGRILVSAAEQKGRRLIAVTICDGNDWNDHAALYKYGFEQYEEKTVISAGEKIAKVPLLTGGDACLLAGEDFSYALAEGECLRVVPLTPRLAFAEGSQGSHAGTAAVFLGERQIGTINLLWGGKPLDGTHTENHIRPRSDLPAEGGGAPAPG